MYQSFIFLEVRILLSDEQGVFERTGENAENISVKKSVLEKIGSLSRAFGAVLRTKCTVEKITGNVPLPLDSKETALWSLPIADGGSLDIMFHQKAKTVKIEEMRLEEDCGRLTHSAGKSEMDFSNAGAPSLRLRTTQAFELGEEAELFLEELSSLLRYLGLSYGEKAIRCNAYVSLAEYPKKPEHFVKLRNLNSFNFVREAINAETSRQMNILSCGGEVMEESRLWISERGNSESYQARKSDQIRFRAIEPPLFFDAATAIAELKMEETELPKARKARIREQYGLSRLRAEFICTEKERADFFEKTVAEGAEPLATAHWIASEVTRVLNYLHLPISKSKITPKKFAEIISLLTAQKIHSGIAKKLVQEMIENDSDISVMLKEAEKDQLASPEKIRPFVREVLAENVPSALRLKNGDMAPLEYLTGLVMKKTEGRAVPILVKQLIKEELEISVIYVLGMGGAITAVKRDDGSVESGGAAEIRDLCKAAGEKSGVQALSVRSILSEETEPQDFASLIAQISAKINSGSANGIVVTHGTDTLPYTAALLFWLFGAANVPVVLTASAEIPSESSEARKNLALAIQTARENQRGVFVAFGGKILSPLNLKFVRQGADGFCNWNLKEKVFTENGAIATQFAQISELDGAVLQRLLEECAAKTAVITTYPGFRSDRYSSLLSADDKLRSLFVELFAAGTGNMRDSDFSLKPLFKKARRLGCRVYCTSQQESAVNFGKFVTSADVWRGGAVPMGILTTESALALCYAASLLADSEDEFAELMESYASVYA